MKHISSVRVSLPLLAALALPASLRADASGPKAESTTPPGRIVIRGSGSDVRLERETAAPVSRRSVFARSPTLLDEIARMARGGASDPVLLTYLKTHTREIPKVLNQEELLGLRREGVSDAVVGFLSRSAAIDIGLTGEGHESPVYSADAAPYTPESDMGGAYLAYGGGYPFVPRRSSGINRVHRVFPPRPHPVLTRPMPAPQHTIGRLPAVPHRPGDGF
jgi:hypothetical protein